MGENEAFFGFLTDFGITATTSDMIEIRHVCKTENQSVFIDWMNQEFEASEMTAVKVWEWLNG